MTDTTYEEAKRCPKCKTPGREAGSDPGPHRSTLHKITCVNNRCSWFETVYVVQVNSDGTVPEPSTAKRNQFPRLPNTGRSDEEINEQLARLYTNTLVQNNQTNETRG